MLIESSGIFSKFGAKIRHIAKPITVTSNFEKPTANNMKTKFLNYFLIIGLLFSSCGQISYAKFDSDKWKNSDLNKEENWNLRWKMMNDLRKNHELIGMKKTEIEKLLGKPDSETNSEFSYYLGMTGTGINTGSLTITFNESGIVEKINVHQG